MTLVKKEKISLKLALTAARKRQNLRTGFLHFDPEAVDDSALIPLYENFCFVLALFRERVSDSVLEGKDLLLKLLHFQTEEGNFPIYIHEYPVCKDFHLSLKIAPVLHHILREFRSVIGKEAVEKIEKALKNSIREPKSDFWKSRYLALKGEEIGAFKGADLKSLKEWVISKQLLGGDFLYPIPFNETLQILEGSRSYFEGDVEPEALEYVLAESLGLQKRLLKDHIEMLYSALIYPFASSSISKDPIYIGNETLHMIWGSEPLMSLSSKAKKDGDEWIFHLDEEIESSRDDLFECPLFCTLSEVETILVEGKKATVFSLSDLIEIQMKDGSKVMLSFHKRSGEGKFLGHISRANRKEERAAKGERRYEAFDLQVALRTLERKKNCQIAVKVKVC